MTASTELPEIGEPQEITRDASEVDDSLNTAFEPIDKVASEGTFEDSEAIEAALVELIDSVEVVQPTVAPAAETSLPEGGHPTTPNPRPEASDLSQGEYTPSFLSHAETVLDNIEGQTETVNGAMDGLKMANEMAEELDGLLDELRDGLPTQESEDPGAETDSMRGREDESPQKTPTGKNFSDIAASGLNKAADAAMSAGNSAAPFIPGGSVPPSSGLGQMSDSNSSGIAAAAGNGGGSDEGEGGVVSGEADEADDGGSQTESQSTDAIHSVRQAQDPRSAETIVPQPEGELQIYEDEVDFQGDGKNPAVDVLSRDAHEQGHSRQDSSLDADMAGQASEISGPESPFPSTTRQVWDSVSDKFSALDEERAEGSRSRDKAENGEDDAEEVVGDDNHEGGEPDPVVGDLSVLGGPKVNAGIGDKDGMTGRLNSIPGGMDGIPGGMNGTPGGMDGMPGGMDGMPGGMDGMPGGMDDMPGGMDGMPGGMDGMPGGMDDMPGGMDGMPGGMDGMPGGMDGMPAGMDGMPGGMDGMPGGMDGIPGRIDGMPGGMDGMPGGMDGMPGGMDGMPGGMDGTPGGMGGRPGGGGDMGGGSGPGQSQGGGTSSEGWGSGLDKDGGFQSGGMGVFGEGPSGGLSGGGGSSGGGGDLGVGMAQAAAAMAQAEAEIGTNIAEVEAATGEANAQTGGEDPGGEDEAGSLGAAMGEVAAVVAEADAAAVQAQVEATTAAAMAEAGVDNSGDDDDDSGSGDDSGSDDDDSDGDDSDGDSEDNNAASQENLATSTSTEEDGGGAAAKTPDWADVTGGVISNPDQMGMDADSASFDPKGVADVALTPDEGGGGAARRDTPKVDPSLVTDPVLEKKGKQAADKGI